MLFDQTATVEYWNDGNNMTVYNGKNNTNNSNSKKENGTAVVAKALEGGRGTPFYSAMDSGQIKQHNLVSDSASTSMTVDGSTLFQNNALAAGFNMSTVATREGEQSPLSDVQLSLKEADGSKFVRILQRPSSVTTELTSGIGMGMRQGHDDGLDSPWMGRPRGGHRKKTLSLNPEEREALENLIEEVI